MTLPKNSGQMEATSILAVGTSDPMARGNNDLVTTMMRLETTPSKANLPMRLQHNEAIRSPRSVALKRDISPTMTLLISTKTR